MTETSVHSKDFEKEPCKIYGSIGNHQMRKATNFGGSFHGSIFYDKSLLDVMSLDAMIHRDRHYAIFMMALCRLKVRGHSVKCNPEGCSHS